MRRALALSLALAAAAATPGAQAQELGRLFFTPEQRAALDARRKARVFDKPATVMVASPTTRLDGIVRRAGGRSTVWLNGEPLSEGSQSEAVRLEPGRATVPVGESGSRVPLRVGETLDRGSGEVRDLVGGEIRVNRREAAKR